MTTQVRRLAAHKDASSTARILAHTVSDLQLAILRRPALMRSVPTSTGLDTKNEREIFRNLKEVIQCATVDSC